MSFQRPEQGVFCQEMGIRDRSFLSSLPQSGGTGIAPPDNGHRRRNDCTLARYQCDLRANAARQSHGGRVASFSFFPRAPHLSNAAKIEPAVLVKNYRRKYPRPVQQTMIFTRRRSHRFPFSFSSFFLSFLCFIGIFGIGTMKQGEVFLERLQNVTDKRQFRGKY